MQLIGICAIGLPTCSPNAVCKDTMSGFNCTCLDGYKGDGFNCVGRWPSKPCTFYDCVSVTAYGYVVVA